MGGFVSYQHANNVAGQADLNRSNNNSGDDQTDKDDVDPRSMNTNTNAFAFPDVIPLNRSDSEIFLEDTVSSNSVVIFSKTTCSFCDSAKGVFDSLGVDYKTIELDKRRDCTQLQDSLKQMTGARSVPRVFVDGVCIGGGSDTVSMFQRGTLQRMLLDRNIECPKCVG